MPSLATASAIRAASIGIGRAAGSQARIASTEVKAGSTGRPSGPATVTIESSWVLSTVWPKAPTPSSPRSATSGIEQALAVQSRHDLRDPQLARAEPPDRLDQPRRRRAVVTRAGVRMERAALERNTRAVGRAVGHQCPATSSASASVNAPE